MSDLGKRIEAKPQAVSELDDALADYFHYGSRKARLLLMAQPEVYAAASKLRGLLQGHGLLRGKE